MPDNLQLCILKSTDVPVNFFRKITLNRYVFVNPTNSLDN